MIHFSVTADLSKLARELDVMERSVRDRVIPRALNRTAAQVRTVSIRAIARGTGLKAKEVRPAITIARATRARHEARVIARGKARNLIHFVRANQRNTRAFRKAKGVIANTGKGRQVHPGAFIGRGRISGKMLVYIRDAKEQYPISTKMGPGIEETFAQGHVNGAMRDTAKARFIVNMRREIAFAIRKAGVA